MQTHPGWLRLGTGLTWVSSLGETQVNLSESVALIVTRVQGRRVTGYVEARVPGAARL